MGVWQQLSTLWRDDEASQQQEADSGAALDFESWANTRQIVLLLALSGLVIVLNLPFHVILRQIPDVEPERISLRLIPMAVAALCLLALRLPPLRERARVLMSVLMTTQLCCSLLHVVEANNHAMYVAAVLTPLYASQLPFVHSRDLLLSLILSYAFYLVLLVWMVPVWEARDGLAIMLIGCAGIVSALLGGIRIRALNHEFRARATLAAQSEALALAEQRSRALAQEALAANRAKSTFLANMSHELRTPLNAIIGYSELLDDEAEEGGFGEIQPDLYKIKSAAHHLLSLLNDVLDLSKVEAGRMDVIVERFELGELLDELREMGEVLAAQHQNVLRVVGRQPSPVMVSTDRQKVRQIMINLLSNAAKFTRDGTLELRCHLTHSTDTSLELSVTDTGIGMSPEQLSRLFQSFVQVHDPNQRAIYGGTGLGLALCKRFTELLHGSLTAQSEPGVGSCFTLRIPLS